MSLFKKKKEEREIKKIWLNGRWYLELSEHPPILFDLQGIMGNGQYHPLGYSCKHRTSGGFCDECWTKFIKAGLKAINRRK